MKIKTLFFPLILSVVNFGCLNNSTNHFSSSDANYPASSASDYPVITKTLENLKNEYKVSPKEAEKRCLTYYKETGEIIDFMAKAEAQGKEELPDSIAKKVSKLNEDDGKVMCPIAVMHRILSQDLNGAKNITNKICAIMEKMNAGLDCKQMYETTCSAGDAGSCEMKKALGY